MIRSSDSLKSIAPALVKVQQAMEAVTKSADNPYFKSKYADLNSVLEATKELCNKNGIAIIQLPSSNEVYYEPGRNGPADERASILSLTTRLQHTSGEFIEATAQVPLAKSDPQGFGSAMTYARRYSLQAALALQSEDDDAESAVTHSAPKTTFNKAAGNTPARKAGSLFPGRK